MTIRYYSQGGEDALLWSAFPGVTDGVFIEVGAFDGRYLSNTLSFEEQGWTGICVEPHPDYFDLCRANRPGSHCENAACVGPGGPETVTFLSEPLGILSGVRADLTPNMEGRYSARGMTFPGFMETTVRARTLDSIIAEHRPDIETIDILSIDVEGTEVDVLLGFSLNARVIVLEANTPDAVDAITACMERRRYHLARVMDQNYFYTSDSEIAARLSAATFDIVTEKTLHPLGAQATHPEHTGKRICLG